MDKKKSIKEIFSIKEIPLILAIIVVIIMFTLINNSYFSAANFAGIATTASVAGIIAVGMGMLLISGNVDLAAGAEGMLAGVLVALMIRAGVPWPLAAVLGVVFGAAAGAINAFFVNKLNFMPFIATIGMSSVYKGLGYILTNSENVPIDNKYEAFYTLGSGTVGGVPIPFIIMIVLMIIYGVILSQTKFGRTIYMCGGNRRTAYLAGISPQKISTILFINCGAMAGLSGVIVASRMHSGAPTAVIGSEMDAITASVLGGIAFFGGTGTMSGAFLGLMLVTCFKYGLTNAGIAAYWQTLAQGLLLFVALTMDYFSERSRQKILKASKNAE